MVSFSEYPTKAQLSHHDFYNNYNLISGGWREGTIRDEKEVEMRRKKSSSAVMSQSLP